MAMTRAVEESDTEKTRILLGLLDSVDRDGTQSQRRLASELGIAVGLVNAYIKRCVNKGLIKVNEVPARRYAYFLTPRGFAEKSRLTVEYLSISLSLFRRAKADYLALFQAMHARGADNIALLGISDLTEIAMICAPDSGVAIVAVVDSRGERDQFFRLPVVKSLEEVEGRVDAVIVTDLRIAPEEIEAVIARVGRERVRIPDLLGPAAADIQEAAR